MFQTRRTHVMHKSYNSYTQVENTFQLCFWSVFRGLAGGVLEMSVLIMFHFILLLLLLLLLLLFCFHTTCLFYYSLLSIHMSGGA